MFQWVSPHWQKSKITLNSKSLRSLSDFWTLNTSNIKRFCKFLIGNCDGKKEQRMVTFSDQQCGKLWRSPAIDITITGLQNTGSEG